MGARHVELLKAARVMVDNESEDFICTALACCVIPGGREAWLKASDGEGLIETARKLDADCADVLRDITRRLGGGGAILCGTRGRAYVQQRLDWIDNVLIPYWEGQ